MWCYAGGHRGPNYDAQSVEQAGQQLRQLGMEPVLMVDCSHGNSAKQHALQEEVWQNLVQQRVAGNRDLIGLMVESNLEEGTQPIPADRRQLRYDDGTHVAARLCADGGGSLKLGLRGCQCGMC